MSAGQCEAPGEQPSLAGAPRVWGSGWRRYFFPAFWLVYLGQAVAGVSKHSHGAAAVVGYVLVVLFAAAYLTALPMGWRSGGQRVFWWLFATAIGNHGRGGVLRRL